MTINEFLENLKRERWLEMNDHQRIIKILTDFILKYGKHQFDNPLPNCWEAGMMKACIEINKYYKGVNNYEHNI